MPARKYVYISKHGQAKSPYGLCVLAWKAGYRQFDAQHRSLNANGTVKREMSWHYWYCQSEMKWHRCRNR